MLTADHQITNGKGFCIMNNKGLIKEIFVMTLADAITAIAVFFFWYQATHRSAVFPVSELF